MGCGSNEIALNTIKQVKTDILNKVLLLKYG